MKKPYNEKYLSKRPFLIISTRYTPVASVKTSVKAWGANRDNWNRTEVPVIVDRVTAKHLTEADVIVDIMEQKCIKNRDGNGHDDIVRLYLNKYANDITGAVATWTKNSPDVREWIKAQADERAHEMIAGIAADASIIEYKDENIG